MSKTLNVLVVEDNAILASEIADLVADAGGTFLGPAASVHAALASLQSPDAALLDINVADGQIYPVADRLMDLGTPFAFVSSELPKDTPAKYRGYRLISKPAIPQLIHDWLLCDQEGRAS